MLACWGEGDPELAQHRARRLHGWQQQVRSGAWPRTDRLIAFSGPEPVRVADTAQAERALAWTPVVPMVEGLRRTVEVYRQTLGQEFTVPDR